MLLVDAYTDPVGSLALGAVCVLAVVAGLTASRASSAAESTIFRATSAGFGKGIAVAAITALVLGAIAIVAFAIWFASSGVPGGY